MPRPPDVLVMTPAERRQEIASVLAAAMVRLLARPGAFKKSPEELQESSPTALAIRPCSATHVTVREDVTKPTENQT